MCKLDFIHKHIHYNFALFIIAATTAMTLDQLSNTIASDYDGSPPLYITKISKNSENFVYVNNARIIKSDIQAVNRDGKKQVHM